MNRGPPAYLLPLSLQLQLYVAKTTDFKTRRGERPGAQQMRIPANYNVIIAHVCIRAGAEPGCPWEHREPYIQLVIWIIVPNTRQNVANFHVCPTYRT